MTDDKIKEHSIKFLSDISRDCTETSELEIERYLFDYTRAHRHLHEFKYQDIVEVGVLRTFLVDNGYVIYKGQSPLTNQKLYTLTKTALETSK